MPYERIEARDWKGCRDLDRSFVLLAKIGGIYEYNRKISCSNGSHLIAPQFLLLPSFEFCAACLSYDT